jgi:hypothetical protein
MREMLFLLRAGGDFVLCASRVECLLGESDGAGEIQLVL